MTIYIAEKDGQRFIIQPFMLKACSDLGYKLYKQIEVEITDIEAELENIEPTEFSGEVEGVHGESN